MIFLSGCIIQNNQSSESITENDMAASICVAACNDAKNKGQNLENGPCLLNPMKTEKDFPNLSNWVCDVAHSPRQTIDNQIENTCSAYREGIANHFVEVDNGCNVITIL
jgi:hypothetical protein